MTTYDAVISDTARAVNTIRASHVAGEISDAECKELIKDVFDSARVDELTSDLNLRSEIYTGLKNLYIATKMILPFI
jgi:hypothetical protein